MKLTLVRHGETEENAAKIIQGQIHGTLSPKGIEQAKTVAQKLKNNKYDIIYSSDLGRCVNTSKEIIKFHKSTKFVLRTELREFNFGIFEGYPYKHVRWGFRPALLVGKYFPGIETPQDVLGRIKNFLNNVYSEHPDYNVLIVTHGGPIRMAKTLFDGDPLKTNRDTAIPNCSTWQFEMTKPIK